MHSQKFYVCPKEENFYDTNFFSEVIQITLDSSFVKQNEVNMQKELQKPSKEKYVSTLYKQSYHYIDALQDITWANNSGIHRSIKIASAQVTMSKVNSERKKN